MSVHKKQIEFLLYLKVQFERVVRSQPDGIYTNKGRCTYRTVRNRYQTGVELEWYDMWQKIHFIGARTFYWQYWQFELIINKKFTIGEKILLNSLLEPSCVMFSIDVGAGKYYDIDLSQWNKKDEK